MAFYFIIHAFYYSWSLKNEYKYILHIYTIIVLQSVFHTFLSYHIFISMRNLLWRKSGCENLDHASSFFFLCEISCLSFCLDNSGRCGSGVSAIKKKERWTFSVHSCTKTFNLTHSRDTGLETLHPWARRLAFRYARYTLQASLSTRENACGCCTLRSGSCGILQERLQREMKRRVGCAK